MRLGHPALRQLMRLSDDELPQRQAARVLAHLDRCPRCRADLTRIEALLQIYASEQAHEMPLADSGEARRRFQARLAVEALQPVPARWHWQWVAAFALALLAVGFWLPRHRTATPQLVDGGQLPNPRLTPGAAQQVGLNSICNRSQFPTNFAVAPAVARRVLREYGVTHSDPANFEVDYLITPGLGGTADIRNLWPEPRFHTAWNSYVKDRLEQYLQQSVCRGEVPLTTAQKAIAGNWIAAYKFYFHTDQPETARAQAPTTPAFLALLDRPYM